MSKKLLAAVATIGGVGIGVPVYLVSANNSSEIKVQSSPSPASAVSHSDPEKTTIERRSAARGNCSFINLPSDISSFLEPRHSDRSNHATVSCINTSLKSDYVKLPSKWIGWVPLSMFSEQTKTSIGQEVEINTSTKQEDGDRGSYTEITFEGKGLSSSFAGEIEDLRQQPINRKVSLSKASGGDKSNLWVYLFSDLQTNTGESEA